MTPSFFEDEKRKIEAMSALKRCRFIELEGQCWKAHRYREENKFFHNGGYGPLIIDRVTGVNYVGNMKPLYNADGSLIVTDVKELEAMFGKYEPWPIFIKGSGITEEEEKYLYKQGIS